MPKASDFIDRLVERLDRLDSTSVQGYILRLVRERGLLSTVFQSIHEGILIVDRGLIIRYANPAAEGLLGLPSDAVERENHRVNRYLRDIDWDRLMSQDPSEWERVSRQEIEIYYPQHRFLEFYLLPYHDDLAPDEDDDLGMVIVILHDVTELRQRTESTIESERLNAITMLAGAVAHEIGNPLNSLSIHLELLEGFIEGLPADTEGLNDARRQLSIATEEVTRLDTIITQFLKAIRPTPADLAPLQVTDIIDDSLDFLQLELADRNITVTRDWPSQVPLILGDADQLRQALYNIVSNAMNAMPGGGGLHIEVIATRDKVTISVADTGRGIRAEDIGRIFEPYFTTRDTGTGLGLVVVERIVRQHGGTLAVDSEPGVGTAFRLTFPRADRPARLLEPPEEE